MRSSAIYMRTDDRDDEGVVANFSRLHDSDRSRRRLEQADRIYTRNCLRRWGDQRPRRSSEAKVLLDMEE